MNSKKVQYLLFSIVATAVIGCSGGGDFDADLTENPNQLSLETFFNTPEGVNTGLIGVYHYLTNPRSLGALGKGLHGHHRSDEMSSGTSQAVPGQRTVALSPSWFTIQQPWSLMYTASLQASTVIENIDNADFGGNTALRDAYLGEAHMLRAFAHWFLLIHYRNVPILDAVPDRDSFVKDQAPPDQVWDFIISELITAKGLLP